MALFRGRSSPNNAMLSARAEMIGTTLFEAAPERADFYRELLIHAESSPADQKIWGLQIEELLFYLHLFDRLMFAKIGPDKRNVFIDALYLQLREKISRTYDSGADASIFRDWWDTAYNERQSEYSEYRLSTPNGESLKGDLFWECSKKLMEIAGITNPVYFALFGARLNMAFNVTIDLINKSVLSKDI